MDDLLRDIGRLAKKLQASCQCERLQKYIWRLRAVALELHEIVQNTEMNVRELLERGVEGTTDETD